MGSASPYPDAGKQEAAVPSHLALLRAYATVLKHTAISPYSFQSIGAPPVPTGSRWMALYRVIDEIRWIVAQRAGKRLFLLDRDNSLRRHLDAGSTWHLDGEAGDSSGIYRPKAEPARMAR